MLKLHKRHLQANLISMRICNIFYICFLCWLMCVPLISKTIGLNLESSLEPQGLWHTLLQKDMSNNEEWRALLHYRGNHSLINKRSSFFLSQYGYKNPQAEYTTLIYRLMLEENARFNKGEKSFNDDESLVCQFPMRLHFLSNQLQGFSKRQLDSIIEKRNCIGYQEFLQRVPFHNIFIDFAGESDSLPGSSMGHIFIEIDTQSIESKDMQSNLGHSISTLDSKQAQSKSSDINRDKNFSISFFMTQSLGFNPLTYAAVFTTGVQGYFALQPLQSIEHDYLNNEKRSIYRFLLHLSKQDRLKLQKHLWELKDREILYKFIQHNCNDAIRSVLGAVNTDFLTHSKKPYQTPTEYLKYLDSKNLITFNNVYYPHNKETFIKKYGFNEITKNKKNSRISLAYGNFLQNNAVNFHHFKLEFSPIYSDLRNANTAYKEHIESKLLSTTLGFDFYSNKPYIEKLDILKMQSILDFIHTKSLSKYMRFGLETNLYNHSNNKSFTNVPNQDSYILPTIEAGLGFGAYMGKFAFYTLPKLSYRYDVINNVALNIEIGYIASFNIGKMPVKWIFNYNYYYDFLGNNRGYDSKLYHYLGIALRENIDFFIETSLYQNIMQSDRIFYAQNVMLQNNIGMVFYF